MNAKDAMWLSPLHHAAARGHTAALKELLRHNADIMARDRNWMTPFHLAAMNNHVQCAGKGSFMACVVAFYFYFLFFIFIFV